MSLSREEAGTLKRLAQALALGVATSAVAYLMMMAGLAEGVITSMVSAVGEVLLWPALRIAASVSWRVRSMVLALTSIAMWSGLWGLALWFLSRRRAEHDHDAA
jgi:hypothetical protein